MYFQLFQGVNNQWFWRLYTEENQKVAFSSEGYEDKEDAIKFISIVKSMASDASIKELSF